MASAVALPAIRALPSDVRHMLRSLFVVFSPAQAAEELVLNSLDAGSCDDSRLRFLRCL
jgi:DNA mismatch repair ATPase MutL